MTIEDLLEKYEIDYPAGGASCGDGWLPLLDKLFQDMIAAGWDRGLFQVKEKFGGLRLYTESFPNERVCELIEEAVEKSATICESCGEPGKYCIFGDYWIKVFCESCEQERRIKS